ncbi:MAG: pyridoxal phosphate-dependent aminotransferase, partial [Bacteroidia bacterium]|nr:pyridoxal phosphate-dependent aminotransferase [Bacteroidia bacterium]
PYLGQILAEACFDNGQAYISTAKEKYNMRRLMLYNGLKAIDGVECYLPSAAFYNIVKLPFDDVNPFCQWLLSDFSLNNATVMLAPADGFYFNQELGKSQVRIAYVLNQENLGIALECLKVAIAEYKEKAYLVRG